MLKLHKVVEQVYKLQVGDPQYAHVRNGVCERSQVVPATGAVWRSNNPEHDPWAGSSVDELKASGFTYASTNTMYLDDQGEDYFQDGDTWQAINPENPLGEIPESEVELV